jgi:DNA polymerase-3 subunit gamma/tau
MSYQVLARKWRPKNFSEVIGQEHVLRVLINSIAQNKLHHAYLFTGTRGVGKTTIARILAKCLSCETGITAAPCGICSACTEIDEGRFIDLIEVDAASRTKVEDTRQLLDNIQYLPAKAKFKVYIIDEVHMLSGHSFNALLKTLEEPPEHVKFLLATTDPQKLPITVLSRCLQFNLKSLTPEYIQKQLENILTKEKIAYESSALLQLAYAAKGSVRDSLSLLDQAIGFGNGKINIKDIEQMLGAVNTDEVVSLLACIVSGNTLDALNKIHHLADFSVDFIRVIDGLLEILHHITIIQQVPDTNDMSMDTWINSKIITELAQKLDPEDIQLYYQICLLGKKDINLAPSMRLGFEMIVLRKR